MSRTPRAVPRYLWPADHQRPPLSGDLRIAAERERIRTEHLAQGAPRDLGGYLQWLEARRQP